MLGLIQMTNLTIMVIILMTLLPPKHQDYYPDHPENFSYFRHTACETDCLSLPPEFINNSANKSARDNDVDNCKHNYTKITPHLQKLPRLLNSKITNTTWDLVEPYNIWLGLALDFLQSSQHKLHYNLNCIVPKLSLNLVFHFLKLVFHKSSTQPTTKQGSPSSPSFCSILPIYNLLI